MTIHCMDVKEYLQNSFIDLGLSKEAGKAYFSILNAKGDADAYHVKKQLSASTAGVYRMIDMLIENGFILPSSSGRPITYTAIPFGDLAKKFEAKGRKFTKIASKLKELSVLSGVPQNSQLYQGNALKDFYLEIPYRIDDFTWCVGSFDAVMNIVGLQTERDFIKIRSKRGCKSYSIIFDDSKYTRDLAKKDRVEKRETRFLPCKNYPMEFSYLFGNTIIDFYKTDNDNVKVLTLESPQLAKARLFQNQVLWNSAKETTD